MLLPVLPYSSLARKFDQQAFTLVETLLYLALFGVIMMSLTIVGFALVKHSQRSVRSNGNLMEASFIRDKINYFLSTNIVANSEVETSQLVLQVPGHTTRKILEQTDDQLVIQYESGESTALSNPVYKLTSLNLKLLNQSQMLIEFQLDEQKYIFHQQLWTNPR